MRYIVIFITCPGAKDSRRIADKLLKAKLVACVNTVPKITSRYWWKGKIEKAEECLLIAKTEKRLFKAVEKKVKSIHSYTVPEIIAVPIEAGNPDYLKWISESVK